MSVVIIKVSEIGWIGEEVCFVFVQLDVRDESRATNIIGESLLQKFNSLHGQIAQILGLIEPRKIGGDSVKIDHSGEKYILRFFLRKKTQDVVLHWRILTAPAAMDLPLFLCMSDEH